MTKQKINDFQNWYKSVCNASNQWKEIRPEDIPEDYKDVLEWLDRNHCLWWYRSRTEEGKLRLFVAFTKNDYGPTVGEAISQSIERACMSNNEYKQLLLKLEEI